MFTTFSNTLTSTDVIGDVTRTYAEYESEDGTLSHQETTHIWDRSAGAGTTYTLGYTQSATSGEWALRSTCMESGKDTTVEAHEVAGDSAEAWIRMMRQEHGFGTTCADCGEMVGSQWADPKCALAA